MYKFKFAKDNSAGIPINDAIPDVNDVSGIEVTKAEANRAIARDRVERRKQEKVNKRKRKELRKPYAIYYGDSQALLRGELADRSKMFFYHDSLPEFQDFTSPEGVPMVHQMKRMLREKDSGHREVFLPKDNYAGLNEDWDRLAPNGLKVFIPNDAVGTLTEGDATSPVIRSRIVANSKRGVASLRSMTGGQPNPDELDPTHPVNILRNQGGQALLDDIFTGGNRPIQTNNLDDEVKLRTCICGHSEEAHQHGAQNRRLHNFIPKWVMGADNQLKPGIEVRAAQSPLLFSRSPRNYGDDPSSPNTENIVQIADRISDIPKMPVVQIGKSGIRVRKLVSTPNGMDQFGKPFSPVVARPSAGSETGWEKCPGQFPGTPNHVPCYEGSLDPIRQVNQTLCDTCLPGEPIFSDDGERQIGEGLGRGRIRVNNIDDAPNHKICDGRGYTEENENGVLVRKDCTGCNKTGKDLTALERKGCPCPNCESEDGTINLTDANKCPVCNGQGKLSIRKKRTEDNARELPVEQRDLNITEAEGNPVTFMPLYQANTGTSMRNVDFIDGFKSDPDSNCPTCHGDRDFQETDEDGVQTPCKNCRIGSFTDKIPVLPKNTRLVGPSSIQVPEIVYQLGMSQAHPDPSMNPHERVTNFEDVVDSSGLPTDGVSEDGVQAVSYDVGGRRMTPREYPALYVNGVKMSSGTHKALRDKSKKRDVGPNAAWTAGHAQLQDITDLVGNNFGTLPVNIPGVQVQTPQTSETALHPKTQEALSKINETMKGIGIPEGSLSRLPEALESASQIESGDISDEAQKKYQESMEKVIGEIALKHPSSNRSELHNVLKETMPPSPILENIAGQ